MKRRLTFRLSIGPLVIGIALASMEFGLATEQQTPPQVVEDNSTSKPLATFESLVIRFDADKDRSLSHREQVELLKHVEQTYGRRWAEQAKRWLTAADGDGDGTVSEVEWRQSRATLAQRARALAAGQPGCGVNPVAGAGSTPQLPAAPATLRAENRPKEVADNKKPRTYAHAPDLANVAYGLHERNVFDLWKAKSDRPTPLVVYFHGGGFTHGDKTWIPTPLLEMCLSKGISVATVNYRYSTQAPYPAQLQDSARAIQFLRLHAKDWNLDPKSLAVTGGSAGAVISMWLGFFDDMANPTSDDPVKRQSTRPSAIGPVDGQTTLDPRVAARLIGEDATRWVAGPAFPLFRIDRDEDLLKTERAFPLYEEASPVNHLKADATPVFMYYTNPPRPLPPLTKTEGLHNIRLGYLLKERMDKLGIECVLRHAGQYTGDRQPQFYGKMVEFFRKHFPREGE